MEYTKHKPSNNWKFIHRERMIMLTECPKCKAPKGYLCSSPGSKPIFACHKVRLVGKDQL